MGKSTEKTSKYGNLIIALIEIYNDNEYVYILATNYWLILLKSYDQFEKLD